MAIMLKNLLLACFIFVVILLALSFGETAFLEVFAWLSALSGTLIQNFNQLATQVTAYLGGNKGKVALALLLTIPASLWVIQARGHSHSRLTSQRRIAMVLALFLGWLGAHRFYLGQLGRGLAYLLIYWLFAPLSMILGLIDAIRYFLMDDETFASTQLR